MFLFLYTFYLHIVMYIWINLYMHRLSLEEHTNTGDL